MCLSKTIAPYISRCVWVAVPLHVKPQGDQCENVLLLYGCRFQLCCVCDALCGWLSFIECQAAGGLGALCHLALWVPSFGDGYLCCGMPGIESCWGPRARVVMLCGHLCHLLVWVSLLQRCG